MAEATTYKDGNVIDLTTGATETSGEVLGGPGHGITGLTDSSGGTASNTIAAIGATYDQAEVRNAVASLAAKLAEVLAIIGLPAKVVQRDAVSGDKVSHSLSGLKIFIKKTTAVFAVGDRVFWDTSATEAIVEGSAGGSDFFVGTCFEAAGNTATTIKVLLNNLPG